MCFGDAFVYYFFSLKVFVWLLLSCHAKRGVFRILMYIRVGAADGN